MKLSLQGTPRYGFLPALLLALTGLWILGMTLTMIVGDFTMTVPNALYGTNVTSFSALHGGQFWEYILVYFVGIVAFFISALFFLTSNKVTLYFGMLFSLGAWAYTYGVPTATYGFNWFAVPQVAVFVIGLVLTALAYIFLLKDEW